MRIFSKKRHHAGNWRSSGLEQRKEDRITGTDLGVTSTSTEVLLKSWEYMRLSRKGKVCPRTDP